MIRQLSHLTLAVSCMSICSCEEDISGKHRIFVIYEDRDGSTRQWRRGFLDDIDSCKVEGKVLADSFVASACDSGREGAEPCIRIKRSTRYACAWECKVDFPESTADCEHVTIGR